MKVMFDNMQNVEKFIATMRRFDILRGKIDTEYVPLNPSEKSYVILTHVTEYYLWDPVNKCEKIVKAY